MSTESQRVTLRRYYQLVDSGNFAEMLSLFHPEILYERAGHPVITGIEELAQFYATARVIRTGAHFIDAIVIEGEWAVAKGMFQGTLKDSSPVSVGFADLHRFRDGLIWRRHTYFAGSAI